MAADVRSGLADHEGRNRHGVPSGAVRSLRRALPALPLVAFLAAALAWPFAHAIGLALTDSASGEFPSTENLRVLARDPLFRSALLGNVVVPVASFQARPMSAPLFPKVTSKPRRRFGSLLMRRNVTRYSTMKLPTLSPRTKGGRSAMSAVCLADGQAPLDRVERAIW